MKRLLLLVAIVTGTCSAGMSQVSINVNIGAQPLWGPVGYNYVEYYYLPDIDVYYDVPHRQFIYLDGGSWAFSANLPGRCHNYDIYNGYKVVINQPRAYLYYEDHRNRYGRYRGYYGHQEIIRSRPDGYYLEGYRYRDRRDYYDEDRYERRGGGHGRGQGHGRGRGHH